MQIFPNHKQRSLLGSGQNIGLHSFYGSLLKCLTFKEFNPLGGFFIQINF